MFLHIPTMPRTRIQSQAPWAESMAIEGQPSMAPGSLREHQSEQTSRKQYCHLPVTFPAAKVAVSGSDRTRSVRAFWQESARVNHLGGPGSAGQATAMTRRHAVPRVAGYCENGGMRNRDRVGRLTAGSGSILSIGSSGSILSIGSAGSILSIGSAGSILSIGSAGSLASILSVGSFASVGSVLSGLSRWSVLTWRSQSGHAQRLRRRLG
jgi:hypothetical protein